MSIIIVFLAQELMKCAPKEALPDRGHCGHKMVPLFQPKTTKPVGRTALLGILS